MRKLFFLTVFLLLIFSPVYGHDWYSSACCSGQDCHPILCTELIDKVHGIQWREYFFSPDMIHPSQDSQCHVCVHKYPPVFGQGGMSFEKPMCIYNLQGS